MTLDRIGLQKITRVIKCIHSHYASIIIILYVFFSLLSSLSTIAKAPKEIIISAAISLKDGFIEIGKLYEERTGVKINFNFGASGVLQKQIESGAPVDVFASAGEKQMDELEAKDLIVKESRSDFARNTLVLVTSVDSKSNLSSFNELDSTKVTRVAVGSPKTVPAGQYTQQLLTNMMLWNKIQPKLIFAENVRQVLDYVVRGEVEAGIVYASDILIAQDKATIAARAPENFHDPILYPIAVIKESRNHNAAMGFVGFVLRSEGQSILSRYGFLGVR